MNRNIPHNISKYIDKYAFYQYESVGCINKKSKLIVVIPAIKEFHNIKKLLSSLKDNDKKIFPITTILFVINNLKSSNDEIKIDNNQTIDFLNRIIFKTPSNSLETEIVNSGINIAYVDASTGGNELDEKNGGVGLARKIGMDSALKYFDYETNGKNILACLDADCIVEPNYLASIYSEISQKKISAAYVNFEHKLPEAAEQKLAIINYEIFLRYYVLGLKYAESPYAFHTIGSTMICDVESYVKVEGMNKKKAAEDFYFMQKLSKITSVIKISKTTVYPSGRGSWRVPFGTGQRVNRFLENQKNEYLLYSPHSFLILKNWLKIFNSNEEFIPSLLLENAGKISKSLADFLILNNFSSDWEKILANTKTETQLQKQKKMWFDGFKTLKLIHYLRDNANPQINMFKAVDLLFAMMNISFERNEPKYEIIPNLKIQLQYLNKLRQMA